jgi:hypothetical protein
MLHADDSGGVKFTDFLFQAASRPPAKQWPPWTTGDLEGLTRPHHACAHHN